MIYIQSNTERTLPHHFDAACAMYGAIDSAMDYRLTSYEEVTSGKMDALIKNNCFVGSVEFMREVFKRIGKTDVRLPMNSDRPCEIITLAEAHKRVDAGEKLFIKPVEIKLFTGLILDGCKYSCLKNLPGDTKVMAYKPFETKILSEWRIYVHNHKIVDARNYSGDFKVTPFYYHIEILINKNKKTFPCAYTIDIGILDHHPQKKIYLIMTERNVVIEYNDFFSIGHYGIENSIYLRMLMDRYFEITNK